MIFLCGLFVIFYFFIFSNKNASHKIQHAKERLHTYFFVLPITAFTRDQRPLVNVQIENKTFTLLLDLGCSGDICLTSSAFNEIYKKTYLFINTCYGFRGKAYERKIYNIPAIQIDPFIWYDVQICEESDEYQKDAIVIESSSTDNPLNAGRIGWEFCKKTNLFLDLGNSKAAFCDSLETLKKEGYSIETFIKLPMTLKHNLLELEFNAQEGLQNVVLDTGSTMNIINAALKDPEEEKAFHEPGWKPSQGTLNLTFNGYNLAPMPVHAIPVHLPFQLDMILGMPFFKKHLVFFDFTENCVYISKAPTLSGEDTKATTPEL